MKIMESVCLKSEAFIPNPKPFPLTNLLCPSLAPWEKMEWWWTDTHIICKVPRIFIHFIPLKKVLRNQNLEFMNISNCFQVLAFSLK